MNSKSRLRQDVRRAILKSNGRKHQLREELGRCLSPKTMAQRYRGSSTSLIWTCDLLRTVVHCPAFLCSKEASRWRLHTCELTPRTWRRCSAVSVNSIPSSIPPGRRKLVASTGEWTFTLADIHLYESVPRGWVFPSLAFRNGQWEMSAPRGSKRSFDAGLPESPRSVRHRGGSFPSSLFEGCEDVGQVCRSRSRRSGRQRKAHMLKFQIKWKS